MANSDWIPSREQDLMDLCQQWKTILGKKENVTACGWNQGECTATIKKIDTFLSARSAYEANDSTANRVAKDDAKEDAVDAMRDFANSSVRFNKSMDDAKRLPLGVRPKDTTYTSHPRPTSQPVTMVENTSNRYEHKLRAMNSENGTATKPADAYGIRYAWQIGGEKPLSGEALSKTKFSRKTSLTVSHSESEKNLRVYYACCYENSKGDTGTWSPVEEATIG
jgi:hypothetical protein